VVAGGASTGGVRSRIASGKWLALLSLVVVGAAGVVGGSHWLSPASPAPELSAAHERLDDLNGRPAATIAPELPSAAPSPSPATISVSDLPSAAIPAPRLKPQTASAEPPAATAAVRPSSAAAPTLEDELKAVDEARAAFVGHDPALALERVTSYRRRFPAGHFMDETEALEIQALVALGRKEEARSRAGRFLALHPESPYAQRVRSAVGSKLEH